MIATQTILARDYDGPHTPTVQIVHSAETPLERGYAVAIANMFARTLGKSAHRMVDPGASILCVPLDHIAWAVGPEANRGTLNYEQAGRARFVRADWTTPDGLSQMRLLAALIAQDADHFAIRDRWLTNAELKAWHDGGRTLALGGRAFHWQVTEVLGGTTHTDPGKGRYPADLLGQMITQARSGAVVISPVPPTPEVPDVDAAQDRTLTETHEWTGQIGKRVPVDNPEQMRQLGGRTLYLQAMLEQVLANAGTPVEYRPDGNYPPPVQPVPPPPVPASTSGGAA